MLQRLRLSVLRRLVPQLRATVLNQIGLSTGVGLHLLPGRYTRIYVFAALGALAMMLIQRWWAPPIFVAVILVGIAWLLLILLTRKLLAIEQTFPELLRVPILRRLLQRCQNAYAVCMLLVLGARNEIIGEVPIPVKPNSSV